MSQMSILEALELIEAFYQKESPMAQPQVIPLEGYVNRDAAAAHIRDKHGFACNRQYLARLASKGGGPPFRRMNGRWVIYKKSDLDAWAATRISEPMLQSSDGSRISGKTATKINGRGKHVDGAAATSGS